MTFITQEPGCPVLKLKDHSKGRAGQDSDAVTMMRLWTLINGGHSARDRSAVNRMLG